MTDANDNGFRAQLHQIFPRLWRFSLTLTRDHTSAQDLAQSACLRALERQAQFAPGTRMDHWVFRIAHSVWLNELRSRRLRDVKQPVDPDALPSNSPPPEWKVLHSEVYTQVMALPDAQRQTILLVYVEGFSYAEAADILDIPIGTVMSRLATGRRRLTESLADKVVDSVTTAVPSMRNT